MGGSIHAKHENRRIMRRFADLSLKSMLSKSFKPAIKRELVCFQTAFAMSIHQT